MLERDQIKSDILVIGAGPAGLVASTVAAQAGANVLLVGENSWAGGRLALQTQPLQGPRSVFNDASGVEFCQQLLEDAVSAGVELMLNTTVSELSNVATDEHRWVASLNVASEGQRGVSARAVVLATGSREPWLEFPGSDLQGVMLSGDAQEMLNVRGALPGRRVLMVGSDNAGLLIAANLRDAGAEIVAVIDESPRIPGREVNAETLRKTGITILNPSKIALARGRDGVESVDVLRLDEHGRQIVGSGNCFAVDTICLAGPRFLDPELARSAGCATYDSELLGGPVPVHNDRAATNVPSLYVCGDASGVENGAVALETGRLAGLSTSTDLGFIHPQTATVEKSARGRLGYLRRGQRASLKREAKATLAQEHRNIERSNR